MLKLRKCKTQNKQMFEFKMQKNIENRVILWKNADMNLL